MTKTFTQPNFKNLPPQKNFEQDELSEHHFYKAIKHKLDDLYREPSEETIAKILKYAKKR